MMNFKEPKFRRVPVDREGRTTEYVAAAAYFVIETGMSEVPGTLTPYQGKVVSKSGTKILFECVGDNYSRTRGKMESWMQREAS